MEALLVTIGVIITIWVFIYDIFFNKKEAPITAKKPGEESQENDKKTPYIENKALPLSVTSQLLRDEKVYYFSYLILENKGGCMSSSARADYWIALTDKRLLYKAKVKNNDEHVQLIEKNGIVLLDKIGSLEIVKIEENLGCAGTDINYALNVGSVGNNVYILLPNESKGFEIRKTYMELTEALKEDINQQEETPNNDNQ